MSIVKLAKLADRMTTQFNKSPDPQLVDSEYLVMLDGKEIGRIQVLDAIEHGTRNDRFWATVEFPKWKELSTHNTYEEALKDIRLHLFANNA